MKKLLFGLVLAVSLVSAKAEYFATNNLSASNHFVLAKGAVLQTLTLYSTNTVPTVVRLYDGAITNITSAFTNYVVYTTNEVTTVTSTTTGVTNSFTNTVVKYTAQAVAAATNNNTPRVTIVVPASNVPVEYVFNPNELFSSRLTVSNDLTGLSFVLRYRNP